MADQVTLLAVELKHFGYDPTVLIYGPVADDNPYLQRLIDGGIRYWIVAQSTFERMQRFLRIIQVLSFPAIVLDALIRRRSLRRSLSGSWGVLRRLGYAKLKPIYRLRLIYAKWWLHPTLVHIHNCDAWEVIKWVDELGLPIVYTDHSSLLEATASWYTDLPKTVWRADAIICVSNSSAASIRSISPLDKPILVIPNMVPTPPQTALRARAHRDDLLTVGFLSRLAPEKDPEALLEAASIALQFCPNLKFQIHGSGEMLDTIHQRIQYLGLTEHVNLCGVYRRDNLDRIMEDIDVVILTSLSEGLPVSLLEAMAYGKPVVATAVGGVPDLIENGVTGFLVPPRDPYAVAGALQLLAEDRQLYERMSIAARKEYQAKYVPAVIVPKILECYREVSLVRSVEQTNAKATGFYS